MDLLNNPEGILTLIKDIPNTKVGNDIIMIDNLDMLSTSFNMINYPVKMVGITIIFCIDGKLTYNIDTERTSIEANEVMILLPGKIVENIENTSQPKYATISLNPLLLEDLSCNSNFQEMMKQAYVKPVLDFDYDDFNWLIKLYKDLKNYILCSKCIHYEMGIRGYLNIIFSFILKYKNQISQQNSRSKEIYYKFIELVQRNFQKQRSITYYSNLLCLTPK